MRELLVPYRLEVVCNGELLFRTTYNMMRFETVEEVIDRYRETIAYAYMVNQDDINVFMIRQ